MYTSSQALCAIALTSAGSVALAAGQAAPADATNASAVAVDRNEVVPVFRADAFEADDLLRPPMHPPIDQIPALPMPNPDVEGAVVSDGPGNLLFHDPATGITTEIPAQVYNNRSAGDQYGGGFVGADGVNTFEDMFGTRGFGTMTEIVNTSGSPWRMNAKLVQEYVDSVTGNAIYFVCSGAMADPEVVLTAGHCVYNRTNDSSGSDYGFVDRIWVYPGWDGNGLALGNPGTLQNYGWGAGNGWAAWGGYTTNGDFDADIGYISLDRAVGMLTGWFGWRSADWNTCSTLGLTYNNASFPSEGCGTAGLHNGRDMYYWFGSFDSCQGSNQLRINTSPGCFTALWGGQSGSNAYDIVDTSRYAHAVASNSNRTTIGQYAKLWTGAREYMNDDFKPFARGASLDIQALECRVTPTTITAGNSTSTATCQVPNPSNNNPGSASYGFNMYLSTNNNISTGDTLLADRSYTFDYAAVQNVNLNTGNVTIPKNTPSGTYWVGVQLDNFDANYANNETDLWDAQQITVNGVTDIVANTCSAPSGTVYHGDTINVGYNVENEGGDSSTSVTLDFYASTNTDISGGDTFLGSVNIGTFGGSQVKTGSVNLNIPSSIVGNRYIGYIATASNDDFVNQDNEAYDATTINIQGRADMFANYIDALDTVAIPGGSIDVRYNVQNQGTVSSGTYDVDVYASTNTTISVADTLLGSFVMPSLGSGGSDTDIRTVSFPGFMAPGIYFVGMIVEGGLNENDFSDNTAYDTSRVSVVDCPVDFDNSGLLDLADIVAFGQLFQNQDPRVDFDSNGLWDLADIVTFVNLFTAGCP